MTSCDLIQRVKDRIDNEAKFFFIRKKDFKVILTTGFYKLHLGKSKHSIEIDWYEETKPYYTNHSKLKNFIKTHEYIGEI